MDDDYLSRSQPDHSHLNERPTRKWRSLKVCEMFREAYKLFRNEGNRIGAIGEVHFRPDREVCMSCVNWYRNPWSLRTVLFFYINCPWLTQPKTLLITTTRTPKMKKVSRDSIKIRHTCKSDSKSLHMYIFKSVT